MNEKSVKSLLTSKRKVTYIAAFIGSAILSMSTPWFICLPVLLVVIAADLYLTKKSEHS
ncbi:MULTISPECIES: hypothetical protein [Paenibacillus]|uniref:Uncharacterized protein n=1 Tax=Paenibacillus albilobatus TaxID=2716884 RepID=A0A919XFB1_9BACL|nr:MULTISPECIES: hypothetical protein [Paenibacillus]GIO31126.1 hypothetical protein J2TS6_22670 [Paenibacillus albilobatus]